MKPGRFIIIIILAWIAASVIVFMWEALYFYKNEVEMNKEEFLSICKRGVIIGFLGSIVPLTMGLRKIYYDKKTKPRFHHE